MMKPVRGRAASAGSGKRKRRVGASFESVGRGFAGHKVIRDDLDRVAPRGHDLENRFAVAYLFLHRKDRALRRGLLNDRRDRYLGHGQQRVRRAGNMRGVGKHFFPGAQGTDASPLYSLKELSSAAVSKPLADV